MQPSQRRVVPLAADYLIISVEALFERKGLWYPWVTDVLACEKNGIKISVKENHVRLTPDQGLQTKKEKEKRKRKKGRI